MIDSFPGLLNGRELSAVVFIRDYVQLQFDGDILTCVTNPEVQIGGETYRWGDRDYRNALCERISVTVSEASLHEGVEFRLQFADKSIIRVSLAEDAYAGRPEALHYAEQIHGRFWVF